MDTQQSAVNTDYYQLLVEFGEAFNRHDADALVAMMTEDACFYTVAGETTYGNKISGREAIKSAFAMVWEAMPNAHWDAGDIFVCGNRGLTEWVFSGTDKEGKRIKAQGCDIFTFKDGKILVKNAFRKQVGT